MKTKKRLNIIFNLPNIIALAVLLLCLIICWLWSQPDLNFLTPEGFEQEINKLGFFAPLIYILIIAVSVVISPIPGAPLTVVAGTIWGAITAGIYSVIGGFLGSLIAYFLGYTLGRSSIKFFTGKLIYFSKQKGELYLTVLIFITRLLPIFSFDLISYGAGISGLSFTKYAIATLLGMIPSTFLLTYLGASFKLGIPLGITYGLIFVFFLIIFPWLIRKYNLGKIGDIVRIE